MLIGAVVTRLFYVGRTSVTQQFLFKQVTAYRHDGVYLYSTNDDPEISDSLSQSQRRVTIDVCLVTDGIKNRNSYILPTVRRFVEV